MNVRGLIVPGLVFFAGAVFGRLFGVRPLVRGAMTVATMSGMIPEAERRSRSPRIGRRPARRRVAQKRSSKAA